jgi:hypothetical protein
MVNLYPESQQFIRQIAQPEFAEAVPFTMTSLRNHD